MSAPDEYFTHKGILFNSKVNVKSLEDIETLAVKEDDVFVATYTRSGTTWTEEILSLIYNGGDVEEVKSTPIYTRIPYVEYKYFPEGQTEYERFLELPSPRLGKTHVPYNMLPRQLQEGRGKLICVARNPKDVAVSNFYFNGMNRSFKTPASWDSFLYDFMAGNVPLGSVFDHVLGYWVHRSNPGMLFIKYEDLQKDLHGTVKKLADFVGHQLPPGTIDKIVDHCSFKSMSENPMTNYSKHPEQRCRFDTSNSEFIRKGVVGDWKNHFTDKQNEAFDKMLEDKLSGTGLEYDFGI
ncbi:SULT1A4 [Branchiostoma lanceolatum]|uniref:Sulfotransferase n=1 Tax=Branchiostoma lanceolatum TaxID=7740 RepID=A0A8K0EBH9_BRALA|nr:SULT1A4 [Branchiostoma lanceolatum]